MKTQVIGRNGYEYDATQIADNLYIVGKFIVMVENGKVKDTICKATKSNVKQWAVK